MITFRFHSNPSIQTSDGLAPTLCSPRTKQETGTNPTQQPNKTKVGAIPKMRVGANPTHTTPNQTHGRSTSYSPSSRRAQSLWRIPVSVQSSGRSRRVACHCAGVVTDVSPHYVQLPSRAPAILVVVFQIVSAIRSSACIVSPPFMNFQIVKRCFCWSYLSCVSV